MDRFVIRGVTSAPLSNLRAADDRKENKRKLPAVCMTGHSDESSELGEIHKRGKFAVLAKRHAQLDNMQLRYVAGDAGGNKKNKYDVIGTLRAEKEEHSAAISKSGEEHPRVSVKDYECDDRKEGGVSSAHKRGVITVTAMEFGERHQPFTVPSRRRLVTMSSRYRAIVNGGVNMKDIDGMMAKVGANKRVDETAILASGDEGQPTAVELSDEDDPWEQIEIPDLSAGVGLEKERPEEANVDVQEVDAVSAGANIVDWVSSCAHEEVESPEEAEKSMHSITQLATMRQASMAEYVRRTSKRSWQGSYSEGTHVYDPWGQYLAHSISSRALTRVGKHPHLTAFHVSHVVSDNLRFLRNICMVGPDQVPCSPCCVAQFDALGVLFALGRMHGVVDVYDMDECLNVVQKINNESFDCDSERSGIEPVCRLALHKRADVVDLAWMPRCARPPKANSAPSSAAAQRYNKEDDFESLLAIAFANDPFVYVYDVESMSGRPLIVLEHADGRTYGGGAVSVIYIRCAASMAGGGGNQSAPQYHQILSGSKNGYIRMWNFRNSKRPMFEVPADPVGSLQHLGSVVSLQVISVLRNGVYAVKKSSGRSSSEALAVGMRALNLDPYDIQGDPPDVIAQRNRDFRLNRTHQVVVSVTSRGVLCVWDISEESCRGNVPAFGCHQEYHPVNLKRLNLLNLLGNGPDSVTSVSYQSGIGDGCDTFTRAVVKFASSSVMCLDLSQCSVEFVYRVPWRKFPVIGNDELVIPAESKCGHVCLLSVNTAPLGTTVVVDSDSLGRVQVLSFHEHSRLASSVKTTTVSSLPSEIRACTETALVKAIEGVYRYPRLTLPGQVWSTSSRSRAGSDGISTGAVIECSEDLTKFIGFHPPKSKYIWMQFEAGFRDSTQYGGSGAAVVDGSDRHKHEYLDFLLGNAEQIDRSEACMYTVRSVMKNTIELYEEYHGPPVVKGWPIVQLRTDSTIVGGLGTVEGSERPSGEDDYVPLRLPTSMFTVSAGFADAQVAALTAHPCLPHVVCALTDGTVRLLAPHGDC